MDGSKLKLGLIRRECNRRAINPNLGSTWG